MKCVVFVLAGCGVVKAVVVETHPSKVVFLSIGWVLIKVRYLSPGLFEITFEVEAQRTPASALGKDCCLYACSRSSARWTGGFGFHADYFSYIVENVASN